MISLGPCAYQNGSSFPFYSSNLLNLRPIPSNFALPLPTNSIILGKRNFRFRVVRAEQAGGNSAQRRTFLTVEEAGLVEVSGLSTHERFLCRLTISSLNLLRVIAEEEKCSIEELNAGRLCDWFLKDKLKREQNLDSAVLQWDDSDLTF
ncbi:uncharacterized protein LOC111012432 [Momordica charantia]|uniref:Uncharacterized protein LOC111012432 n=1 Tax=Momordica charantia TaxID=3673 RepID=A0A6J1CKG5_MOMCH|nr:uncharacterized protein LOC111012432 [Momordica charantia]